MSDIDLLGEDGGRLALAFAAGCVATFTFMMMIGKWLWGLIGKTKDNEVAQIKAVKDAEITRLEHTMEENERKCAEMETRLIQRIQTLEGFILSMAPGNMRQDFQRVISEQRLEERSHDLPRQPQGAD